MNPEFRKLILKIWAFLLLFKNLLFESLMQGFAEEVLLRFISDEKSIHGKKKSSFMSKIFLFFS